MEVGEQARQEALKALAKARNCTNLEERRTWLEIADQWARIADAQAQFGRLMQDEQKAG